MKKNGNRRALGDIGNLVGAFSRKCVVSKQAAGAENHAVGGNKSNIVLNRPVARQFGATLAKNQQLPQVAQSEEKHVQWGAKQRRSMACKSEKPKIKPDVGNSAESMEDCEIVDSPRIITRSPVVLLKIDENEAMLVDSAVDGHMEDIEESSEMETEEEAENPVPNINEDRIPNIDENQMPNIDQVPNIDEGDEGNPLAVAEYIQDMSRLYREIEGSSCVPPDYMSHQTHINHSMRAVVVDWLIEVHWKCRLMPETLFLAINLMDRYISSQKGITRIVLQLVGITSMLVACKYEETTVPFVEDFMIISNHVYTENDVLQMESTMLSALQFNISVPTPYVFLNRFLKAAAADKHLEMVSFFLVELCLVEYVMLRYPPSMLAAAAVYTGQQTLIRIPPWNRTMEHYTAYTEDQLQECSKLMVGFHQNSRNGNLIAVHKKYSMEEFSSVAQLAPALFIGQIRYTL